MKDRHIAIASLALSVLAFSYAAWAHHRAEAFAAEALRKREAEFVKAHAWKVREIIHDLGGDVGSTTENAETLDDLISPLVLMIEGVDAASNVTDEGDDSGP